MTGFGRTQKRLPISQLVVSWNAASVPEWMKASVEAARQAPSAANRQPWGFGAESDGINVFIRTRGPEFHVSKRLDCGIAMLHIELAALSLGVKGNWEFLASPQVAKFVARP